MGTFAVKVHRVHAARKSWVLTVPEWGMDIHVFPITLGQLSRIEEEQDRMRKIARAICVRARDERGEPLFDAEDFEAMVSQGVEDYGPDVLMRVCGQLGAKDSPDHEAAAEKN